MPVTNPLLEEQYDLGRTLLGLYDPVAEEERRKKALGQTEDVIARRYARAGETGSSVEKDALANAAKDFALDWAERQPKRYAEAISGSQLPIQNFLNAVSQEATYGGTYGGKPTQAATEFAALQPIREATVSGEFKGQPTVQKWQAQSELEATAGWREYLKKREDQALLGATLSSLGIPPWLANEILGVPYGATGTGAGGLVGSAVQGATRAIVPSLASQLYNSIFADLTPGLGISQQATTAEALRELAALGFNPTSAPAAGTGATNLAATVIPSVPTAATVASQLLSSTPGLLEATGPGVAAASGAPYAFGPSVAPPVAAATGAGAGALADLAAIGTNPITALPFAIATLAPLIDKLTGGRSDEQAYAEGRQWLQANPQAQKAMADWLLTYGATNLESPQFREFVGLPSAPEFPKFPGQPEGSPIMWQNLLDQYFGYTFGDFTERSAREDAIADFRKRVLSSPTLPEGTVGGYHPGPLPWWARTEEDIRLEGAPR